MDRARTDAATGAPPAGWVTVAKAAAALTDSGDAIDASNVSRYLQRFREIPSKKLGKYRFVDLAALRQHRRTNILVGEKQLQRAAFEEPAANVVRASRPSPSEDEDDGEALKPGSELAQANVRLKQLQIRERELDLAEREGTLVRDHEVLALVSGSMQAFIEALDREEVAIASAHGREVATAFRKARKAAQAKASAKLLELARKHLPDAMAGQVDPQAA